MATGNILAEGNINKMAIVRRTVDFSSVSANSTASFNVPCPGVLPGDVAFVVNGGTTNAVGLVMAQCNIAAADNIVLRLANVTAGAIDDGSREVLILVIRPDTTYLNAPGW